MSRLRCIAILFVLPLAAAAQSVTADGWTIAAEGCVLRVAHATLGPLLNDIRLTVQGKTPAQCSSEASGVRVTVHTSNPRGGWVFEAAGNTLRISSTSAESALAAAAPAPKDRVPVRLMDPRGAPVDWVGNGEVAGSYGGKGMHNQSYLPVRNPEVMYLALGQIASDNLHELFDRRTGAAVSFPRETVMRRSARNQNVLEVTMPVPGNALVRLIPDYYTSVLGAPFYIPFDDSYFTTAPMVWSSWTSYYAEVTEKDIVRNADWLAEHLKPYGFQYVQLDDGYDRGVRGEHYWTGKWNAEKFPHGPRWLADYIKSKGLHAGLWIVPNAYAGAVEQHPDWYLRDKKGNFVLDYRTPALDSSNPAVLELLRGMFTTLQDWGFDYYKFDGEHALPKYAPTVDLQKLFNPSADPIAVYRDRLKLIRDVIGPRAFIEGCPAGTPLNGIGFFNSYFTGQDLYNNWQGMYPLFSSINANVFLNHMVVYVMPGEGLELGEHMTYEAGERTRVPSVLRTERSREAPLTGFGTTGAEARTLVSIVALTGVAYPLASVMPELPPARVDLLKATMPTMPILPVDLFSRGTDIQWDTFRRIQADYYIHNYPEILDLKVNAASGIYDVAALVNWRSETTRRTLSFAGKLGLDPAASYVVFDFWGRKPLGVFKGGIDVDIEPHGTRVLLIHRLSDHPQLIGTSRHITGAYSVLNLAWDAPQSTLRGASRTVPGDPYTLYFYVPHGVSQVRVGGREVPVRVTDNTLAVTFQGRQEPVTWEVRGQ